MQQIPHPPPLDTHPMSLRVVVQWGDQDMFGHVNNTVYFRWMESARIEYFYRAALGEFMSNTGIGPILASIKSDYKRQVKFTDTLLVSCSDPAIGRTSIKMTHFIYSEAHQAVAAVGESTIVMFNYERL